MEKMELKSAFLLLVGRSRYSQNLDLLVPFFDSPSLELENIEKVTVFILLNLNKKIEHFILKENLLMRTIERIK